MSAAIYAARAELAPLVFEGFASGPVGGQLMTTTVIENFPGFPEGILGSELMQNMRRQAMRFGAKILTEDVIDMELEADPFIVKGGKTQAATDALIIATGAGARRLDIPGARDEEFWQKGVSACAICDGALPLFRDKDLFVIGGGDSAVEEALFLTKYGKKVYIVHRRDRLRASRILADRAHANPKIGFIWNSEVVEAQGGALLEKIVLQDTLTKARSEKNAGGLFFAVGHIPATAFLNGRLQLNEAGYIVTEKGSTVTSKPGVFAAGDVQDAIYRQAITAAGSGCMAALDVEKYLAGKGLLD